ncbi:MAG: protein kinase domain-containing protein, partial [Gemmatimonadota bacterium]
MDDLLRRIEAALAGRYEIEAELGRGGMAVVYRGRDIRHERDVAIKVLPPHLASAIGHERFLHEIKLAARLAHPYIVPILDSGEADGLLYYTMPVVRGETLQDRLHRESPLPIREALTIGCEVAEALAHAHAADVLHRDVKPSNILLTRDHALLADFGVARAAKTSGDERLTGTGVIIGTPAYMSPQQALSDDGLDPSADQYSLACVLYEMLAGRVPFAGTSHQAVLLAHATREPTPLRELRPELPARLAATVQRGMAKEPSNRFPSMEVFRGALAGVAADAADSGGDRAGTVLVDEPETPAIRRAVTVILVGLVATAAVWGASSLFSGNGGATTDDGRIRLAVLPCNVIVGAEHPGDTILGWNTAAEVSFSLDGTAGLDVLAVDEVADIPYPGEDSLAAVANRLGAGTLVQCVLSPGRGDSVRMNYDVWSDGALQSYAMNLARLAPGVLDVERFAVRLVTLSAGDEPFEPTEDVLALRSFLLGYNAFIGERFAEAESLFAAAVRQDSSFALARWRQADVRRWMLAPGPENTNLRTLYERHRERLGRRNAFYVSALALPPAARLPRFDVVLDSLREDAYAHLLYGDELVHRGPLFGFGLDTAAQALRRATLLNPRFAPAWDHLALALMRQGDEAGSDSALVGLEQAASPSPEDYPMPQLLRIAWREHFRPDERGPGRRALIADRERLPAYARAGVRYFDLPELQLVLGLALANEARPGSEPWHSGMNAVAIAHASLGRPGDAGEAFRRATATVPQERALAAGLFANLWSVVPAALGLEGFGAARDSAAHELNALAADTSVAPLHRARAAWALALHEAGRATPTGTRAFARHRDRVRSLTETYGLDARMQRHIEAVAAAQAGRWREALDLGAPLVAWDSIGIVERPFNRSTFYLQRGAWYAALARERSDPLLADSAVAAWIWHLNTDLEGVPMRDVQAAEVDAALGTHARLRT